VTQNATDFLDLVFVEISAAGTFIWGEKVKHVREWRYSSIYS
jgi:hypothetical protein